MVHSDNTSLELVVTIMVISWTNILTIMRPIVRKMMAITIMLALRMAISMILMMAMMIIRGTTWLFLTSVDG